MGRALHRFLFSKWFFGLLAILALFDLTTDVLEHVHPRYWEVLNIASILLDCSLAILAGWMFLDLHSRKPR